MSFYDNAKAIQNKIETVLADENLVLTILDKKEPIALIISQSQSPYAQMDFLAQSENGVSSKDSALRFIFEIDGLIIHTSSRLVITDALMSKLKGLAKKWHTAYCHAYFADMSRQQGVADDTETTPEDAETADSVVEDEESVIDPADIVIDVEDAEDFPVDDPSDDPFADFMAEAEETEDECPEDTEGEE